MAAILVTVGMGPWAFDRLIRAVEPLCAYHDVFVQTGASPVVPPCPHARRVPLDEMRRRLSDADIVITHAGSTVRLVQRLGRVPIAVARRRSLAEIGSDRQERYLRAEERTGRVRAVWDVAELAGAVAAHPAFAAETLRCRALPAAVSGAALTEALDGVSRRLCSLPPP
jgi:UDP-N-acetylglucosamine transferase subunit ALG13